MNQVTQALILGATLSLVSQSFAASNLKLHVNLFPAGSFVAESSDLKGLVERKDNGFVAKDVKLDMTTLRTGISLRDEHMKAKYLETGTFPSAVLEEAQGRNGVFQGRLKVHGVTSNISGTYEIKNADLQVQFSTKVSAFNIAEANYMGVGVEDDVKIEASIPFTNVSTVKN